MCLLWFFIPYHALTLHGNNHNNFLSDPDTDEEESDSETAREK